MAHTFILGITLTLGLAFSSLATAQESPNSEAKISVTSKESQHGQQVGVSSKSGIPTQKVNKNLADKNSGLARAKSALGDHKSKQLAAPLLRSFDRDSRVTPADSADFWVFDAFVNFNIDLDRDGYFSTFTLEFDVDTVYNQAEVYARLYLARGDVFEEYHTTSLFLIEGDISEDQFIVESELLTGFPSDDYELLIEVYDGLNDQLVASFDGFDDADLTLLTLESRSFESQQGDVIVITESGGSFGYLMLLLVPILLIRTFSIKN